MFEARQQQYLVAEVTLRLFVPNLISLCSLYVVSSCHPIWRRPYVYMMYCSQSAWCTAFFFKFGFSIKYYWQVSTYTRTYYEFGNANLPTKLNAKADIYFVRIR